MSTDSDWEDLTVQEHIIAVHRPSTSSGPMINNQQIFSPLIKMQRPSKQVKRAPSSFKTAPPPARVTPVLPSRLPVYEEEQDEEKVDPEFVVSTVQTGGLADAFRTDRVPLPVPLNITGQALVGGLTFDPHRDANNTLSVIGYIESTYSLVITPVSSFTQAGTVGTCSIYRLGDTVTLKLSSYVGTSRTPLTAPSSQGILLAPFIPISWRPQAVDAIFPIIIRTSLASGPLGTLSVHPNGSITLRDSETLTDYQWAQGTANQGWGEINVTWLL
jgi:hypothetical protein